MIAKPKGQKGRSTRLGHALARSPKQEAEVASSFSGAVVKGSGCGTVKGDVRIEGVARIECKTTTRKSFSVTREMINKIEDAALMSGEAPALIVEFIDDHGTKEQEVAVVPVWLLQHLLDAETN